jgi:hypothetical protein
MQKDFKTEQDAFVKNGCPHPKSRAKVYPVKELEHGLRPNNQISQYIIPTKVSNIQPRYDILYIYKSCPVERQ